MKPQPKNPFVGLKSFDANDYLNFFGRDKEISALSSQIKDIVANSDLDPFIIVHGSSGIGKSSLLKAGILTYLSVFPLAGNKSQFVIQFTPNDDPINELSKALATFISKHKQALYNSDEINKILINENMQGLKTILDEILPNQDDGLIILIDQFEAYFSDKSHHKTDTINLISLIFKTFKSAKCNLFVIFSMRSNYLEKLDDTRELENVPFNQYYKVPIISREAIKDVITKPLENVLTSTKLLNNELIELLIRDYYEGKSSLPLIEFTLESIYEDLVSGRLKNVYKSIGTTVEDFIDGRLNKIRMYFKEDKVGEEILRKIFIRMSYYDHHFNTFLKRPILKSELESSKHSFSQIETIIKYLSSNTNRLISVISTDDEIIYLELTHEILFDKWLLIKGILDKHKVFQDTRLTLKDSSLVYKKDNDTDFLWSGHHLKKLKEYKSQYDYLFNSDEEKFYKDCLEYEENKKNETIKKKDNPQKQILISLVLVFAIILLAIIGKTNNHSTPIESVNTTNFESLEAIDYWNKAIKCRDDKDWLKSIHYFSQYAELANNKDMIKIAKMNIDFFLNNTRLLEYGSYYDEILNSVNRSDSIKLSSIFNSNSVILSKEKNSELIFIYDSTSFVNYKENNDVNIKIGIYHSEKNKLYVNNSDFFRNYRIDKNDNIHLFQRRFIDSLSHPLHINAGYPDIFTIKILDIGSPNTKIDSVNIQLFPNKSVQYIPELNTSMITEYLSDSTSISFYPTLYPKMTLPPVTRYEGVFNNHIIFSDSTHLFGLNYKSGKIDWSYNTNSTITTRIDTIPNNKDSLLLFIGLKKHVVLDLLDRTKITETQCSYNNPRNLIKVYKDGFLASTPENDKLFKWGTFTNSIKTYTSNKFSATRIGISDSFKVIQDSLILTFKEGLNSAIFNINSLEIFREISSQVTEYSIFSSKTTLAYNEIDHYLITTNLDDSSLNYLKIPTHYFYYNDLYETSDSTILINYRNGEYDKWLHTNKILPCSVYVTESDTVTYPESQNYNKKVADFNKKFYSTSSIKISSKTDGSDFHIIQNDDTLNVLEVPTRSLVNKCRTESQTYSFKLETLKPIKSVLPVNMNFIWIQNKKNSYLLDLKEQKIIYKVGTHFKYREQSSFYSNDRINWNNYLPPYQQILCANKTRDKYVICLKDSNTLIIREKLFSSFKAPQKPNNSKNGTFCTVEEIERGKFNEEEFDKWKSDNEYLIDLEDATSSNIWITKLGNIIITYYNQIKYIRNGKIRNFLFKDKVISVSENDEYLVFVTDDYTSQIHIWSKKVNCYILPPINCTRELEDLFNCQVYVDSTKIKLCNDQKEYFFDLKNFSKDFPNEKLPLKVKSLTASEFNSSNQLVRISKYKLLKSRNEYQTIIDSISQEALK